jgi:hypothetical protein
MLSLFSASAISQSRSKSKRSRTPAKSTSTVNVTDARKAAAIRVADQVKNLSVFLYLYGGVAKDLQSVDAAMKRGESSPSIVEQTTRSKTTVRNSLANVRDGMDKLEADFSSNSALRPFYPGLLGSSSDAARAMQLADSGQYEESGRVLIKVVNRLTDVLAVLR